MASTPSDRPAPLKGGGGTPGGKQHKKNKAAKKKSNDAAMREFQAEAHNSEAGKAEIARQKAETAEKKKAASDKAKRKSKRAAKKAQGTKKVPSKKSSVRCPSCQQILSPTSATCKCSK